MPSDLDQDLGPSTKN